MVERIGDEVVDEARALPLAELRLEAVAQRLDGLAAGGEAGQVAAGALERALDEREDLGCLLARGQEALDHEVAEAGEGGGARAWLGLGLGVGLGLGLGLVAERVPG